MSQTCTECGFPMDTPERAHAFIHQCMESIAEHRKLLPRLRVEEAYAGLQKQALDAVMVGGNHLASYLIGELGSSFSDAVPPTMPHDQAHELLPIGTYDVWCCWAAIMRTRDLLPERETEIGILCEKCGQSPTPRYGGKTERELRSYHPSTYGPGEIIHALLDEIERQRVSFSEGMPKWFAFAERRPERNANVVYWHSSGYPEISDEWRDEYMAFATHWMPLEAPK